MQQVIEGVQKECGKESIRQGIISGGVRNWPSITTRSISLDRALGIGGVPRGRIIEIFGPESSGKTTLALIICAEAQKLGGAAAFIDAEHAVDPGYAAALNVDLDELLFSQPDSAEETLQIAHKLVQSTKLAVVVIDSVAALVPQAEIDGEIGDQHIGLQARLIGQALRKMKADVAKTKTCVIFINQLRDKVMSGGFGPSEQTPGGRALKFYASVRLDIRRIGSVTEGDQKTGNITKVKIVKNKLAPPFKEAVFNIVYGVGIEKDGDVFDTAVRLGIINKKSSFFSYNEKSLGNGRINSMKTIMDNNLFEEIETKVRTQLFDNVVPIEAPPVEDDENIPEENNE